MQFSFLPTPDTYQTLADICQSEYKEKNSRFIAYGVEIDNEQAVKNQLEEVKKIYPKASHYCYAYRIGLDGNNYRANDDGEPSGTAGRPILNQIDSAQLTNVLVVVVRYYGGVNLGVSGLKEAYKTATRQALQGAETQQKIVKQQFVVQFEYTEMPQIMNWLKAKQVDIISNDFGNQAQLTVAVRLSFINEFISFFEATPNTIINAQ